MKNIVTDNRMARICPLIKNKKIRIWLICFKWWPWKTVKYFFTRGKPWSGWEVIIFSLALFNIFKSSFGWFFIVIFISMCWAKGWLLLEDR